MPRFLPERAEAAHERGEYKHVSNDDLTWILAALHYLLTHLI